MFTPSKSLDTAVRQKDANEVRDAIISYINIDPDNRTGDIGKAIRYAEDQGVDLWEPHDVSRALIDDQTQWTEKYEAKVTTDLQFNFSKERFDHWKAVAKVVGQKVRAQKAQAQQTTTRVETHGARSSSTYDGASNELAKKIAIGVVAAAVVVAVAATIILK